MQLVGAAVGFILAIVLGLFILFAGCRPTGGWECTGVRSDGVCNAWRCLHSCTVRPYKLGVRLLCPWCGR